VVTVAGPGIREPKNVRARLGTLVSDLVDFCGGYTEKAAKLLAGGPMMGIALTTDQVPVIKGTSAIVVLEEREAASEEPAVCISCGRCVDVCPMYLMPCTIATLVDHERWDEAERYNLLDCFECGSCAYVCPAKRHLVQLFKHGKAAIAARRKAESLSAEAGKE
jgi:electron transport complex protein RnfC